MRPVHYASITDCHVHCVTLLLVTDISGSDACLHIPSYFLSVLPSHFRDSAEISSKLYPYMSFPLDYSEMVYHSELYSIGYRHCLK